MTTRVWGLGFVPFLVLLGCADRLVGISFAAVCPTDSVSDAFLGLRETICLVNEDESFDVAGGVIVGDSVSFMKALKMVHVSRYKYVAVVFYASWCPFSRAFGPHFSTLSTLYPSITHLAIEESSINPSILSKYLVHGFPSIFLINSTMLVRYHGSRSLEYLVAFYSGMTGIKAAPLESTLISQIGSQIIHAKQSNNGQESYSFNWTRFPVNMLEQETWLALATGFLLLRFLYFIFPSLCEFAQYTWSAHASIGKLWDNHPQAYLARAFQLFNFLKQPRKRSNLQERAKNARAWASKSLASVSIGDAGTSGGAPVIEHQ